MVFISTINWQILRVLELHILTFSQKKDQTIYKQAVIRTPVLSPFSLLFLLRFPLYVSWAPFSGLLPQHLLTRHHLTALGSHDLPVQLFLICLLAVIIDIDKCTKSKPTNTWSLCACLSLSEDTAELKNTDVITLCNFALSTWFCSICDEIV